MNKIFKLAMGIYPLHFPLVLMPAMVILGIPRTPTSLILVTAFAAASVGFVVYEGFDRAYHRRFKRQPSVLSEVSCLE